VEVSEGSYLDLLARGYRSGYLRESVDRRVEEAREALALLRGETGTRTDAEIVALIEDASVPVARLRETGLVMLRDEEMRGIEVLWAESEATGLDGAELLEALDSGRCA